MKMLSLDQSTHVRPGEELDLKQLAAFLQQELATKGDLSIEQFPRGFSNLTYLLRIGEKEYVLRRPPFGAKIKSAHDMGREYRILNALSKSYPKAPKPALYTEDESIIGSPFYLMERVKGIILRPQMKAADAPDAAGMRAISEALVDTFVELHEVDYKAVGLGELGRPVGYVDRQIEGWGKRYFKAKTDEVPTIEKAIAWLEANKPASSGASLIHNDYKYDNVVLDPADPSRIIAVLDWEMSTLGDPLMDLGTSLGYWVNQDDPAWMQQLALSPTTLPGNPSRAELADLYGSRSGQSLKKLVFYYVYGLFKISVITQQIYARFKLGHTKDERFAHLDKAVAGLGAMAMQAIQKGKVDGLF